MVSGKIFATFLQWFDYLHYSKVVKVLFKHYEIEKKKFATYNRKDRIQWFNSSARDMRDL